MARTGKPISPEERRERSDIELIQNINRSIRFDPAGRKSEVYVMEKLGCDLEISNKILKLIIDPLVEGIRKRTAHDRIELKLRAEARAQAELDGVRSYAVQNEVVATPSGVSNATKLPSEAFAEITEEAKKITGEIFVENGKELIFEGVTGELSMGYFHIFANYIEEGKKTSWVASNIFKYMKPKNAGKCEKLIKLCDDYYKNFEKNPSQETIALILSHFKDYTIVGRKEVRIVTDNKDLLKEFNMTYISWQIKAYGEIRLNHIDNYSNFISLLPAGTFKKATKKENPDDNSKFKDPLFPLK